MVSPSMEVNCFHKTGLDDSLEQNTTAETLIIRVTSASHTWRQRWSCRRGDSITKQRQHTKILVVKTNRTIPAVAVVGSTFP